MAKPEVDRPGRAQGFSLVEMIVALLFVGILMAGMAGVFKSSMASFYATGEKLSSMRRNRSSMDLLYDDLNSAGMFLGDLVNAPQALSDANPAFYILPNQAIANPAADGPQTADQLFFYFDQPLGFEGTLVIDNGKNPAQKTASQLVQEGVAPSAADSTYTIECHDPAYAAQVKPGQYLIFKDFFEALCVITATPTGASSVKVTTGINAGALITGSGPTGAPEKAAHINNSNVVFYNPAQMVRYSIQMITLDPANPAGTPCLVRDQGPYSPAGFTAVAGLQQIITDNVANFKVYLSCNAGQSWAGLGQTYSGMTAGWTNGIQTELNTQLATAGRSGYTTTTGNPIWFRSIPTLVRVDITTRTATKRTEYGTPTTLAYKPFTQSLVIVPRHFGLAMN